MSSDSTAEQPGLAPNVQSAISAIDLVGGPQNESRPPTSSEARFQEFVALYQQTVQGAFREVSDSLIGYQRTREFREKQEERTQANRDATDLANFRYEGGVTSYLEVLYNEQELFNAELGLAQAQRNELLSVVQLYRALGGGWEEPIREQASVVSGQ